jgi:hypothetical protein
MDLFNKLLESGFDHDRAQRAMIYSPMFEGDVMAFIHSVSIVDPNFQTVN